jgi:predicted nucleic acid-binding protein
LKEKGFSIPFADGQIAAITATEDLAVVTQNVSDFGPFATPEDGIRLENWFLG